VALASAFVSRREEGPESERVEHHVTLDVCRAFEAAGVEFTNGDQPGVRVTKAAAAHSRQPAGASAAAEKTGRGKTAKAKVTEKK